jgi:hypothetical protein
MSGKGRRNNDERYGWRKRRREEKEMRVES